MKNFLERLTVSSLLSVILLVTLYFSVNPIGALLFVLLTMAAIGFSLWEYYQIALRNGSRPLVFLGIASSLVYVALLYLTLGFKGFSEIPLISMIITLFIAFLYYFYRGNNPLQNLSVTFFGLGYLTLTLGALIPINFEFGRYWLFYLLLVTKMNDIGAYFIGKKFGKRKLAPFISPKKSWEGAIGGFTLGVIASFVLDFVSEKYLGAPLFRSPFESLWFGALMSIVAQIGDLSESLLKRDTGVKDSNSLPGVGGFLDMVDSLVFTTPLLYFFLRS